MELVTVRHLAWSQRDPSYLGCVMGNLVLRVGSLSLSFLPPTCIHRLYHSHGIGLANGTFLLEV